MQSLSSLLILMVLVVFPVVTTYHDDSELVVLERWSMSKVDMSAESRSQFKAFMESFCLLRMTPGEFLNKYLQWERVEFFRGVRQFLDPTNDESAKFPYNAHDMMHHDFRSNCSQRNLTKIRKEHAELIADHQFENDMYDMAFSTGVVSIGLH